MIFVRSNWCGSSGFKRVPVLWDLGEAYTFPLWWDLSKTWLAFLDPERVRTGTGWGHRHCQGRLLILRFCCSLERFYLSSPVILLFKEPCLRNLDWNLSCSSSHLCNIDYIIECLNSHIPYEEDITFLIGDEQVNVIMNVGKNVITNYNIFCENSYIFFTFPAPPKPSRFFIQIFLEGFVFPNCVARVFGFLCAVNRILINSLILESKCYFILCYW